MHAPYACDPKASRGRIYQESVPAQRSDFQRDRDRIIHSVAFRRLEYKTQVFVNHEGDLYRTRLTHSLEVSQIARSIARAMQLDEDLVEAIALAHDLGHTPFGHAGQDQLNACMKPWGGFEHNLQSLRVVDHLEYKYADFPGLNLTFEAREGILKHCSIKDAKKLGEVGLRFLNKKHASLEAQLTNLSDEIAYNNHDIDDGLRSGLINLEQLQGLPLFARQYKRVCKRYPNLEGRRLVHETIRRMIGYTVNDLITQSLATINDSGVTSVDEVREAGRNLIGFSDQVREENQALKKFLRKNLYQHYRVCRMTSKARRVIQTLFQLFMENSAILPEKHQRFVREAEGAEGTQGRARHIANYIAGMTDRYAIREYQRLIDPTVEV